MGTLIRLNAALDWIDCNDLLADIGCDHGYLAIEALKKGVPFVQLIDEKGCLSKECEEFAGIFAKDADPLIIKKLKAEGKERATANCAENDKNC